MEITSSPDESINVVNIMTKNKARSKSKEIRNKTRTPSPKK